MYGLIYKAGSTFYNYTPASTSFYVPNDINTSIFNTSFSIIGGVQFATKGTIKTTHDIYFGVGLNLISYKQLMKEKVPSRINVNEGPKALGKTIYISFGYAIGIGM